MDLTFTGRDLQVTDEIRAAAEHKLSPLERMEPRTTRVDLEFIGEHHPRSTASSASRRPCTSRARRSGPTPRPTTCPRALDLSPTKLERQIRDHHGKRRAVDAQGVG